MVHPELLKILVCPENKTPVVLAGDDLVAKINAAIEAQTLRNRAGVAASTTARREPRPTGMRLRINVEIGLDAGFRYNSLGFRGGGRMVHPELLKILVCPENKTPVVLAGDDLVAKINGAIEARTLKNRADVVVDMKIDGGLVREDKAYLYPIRDDIPIMLIDEAIPLDQIQ